MKKATYNYFDHFSFDGEYAVRQYDRQGNGQATVYCDTLQEAKEQRAWHGKLIGLEPEPTYKDFALYPTIWKWGKSELTGKECYQRVLGY